MYGYDIKPQQNNQNNGWKHVKSPRSPHIDNQMFSNQAMNGMNGTRTCYNHPGKKSEYMAKTDGEFIYYCEACAAKLAANCFQVIKLPTTGHKGYLGLQQKSKLTYKRRQIPCIPEYKGNPVYESIIEFLREVYTVEQDHFEAY